MTARPGFALVLSLLLVLAFGFVGLGLMAVGSREVAVARALERRAGARTMAEGAAMETAAGWSTDAAATLRAGEERVLASSTAGTRTTITRLGRTLFSVEAEWQEPPGVGPPPALVARAALLVRTLDSERLSRAFPAAATAAERIVVETGEIGGDGPCGHAAAGAWAPEVQPGATAVLRGSPAIQVDSSPPIDSPDPFDPRLARTLASLIAVPPTARPTPTSAAGVCVSAPSNWGSPDPSHACHPLLPYVFADGDLELVGGEARGVLVVDGDLLLRGGARVAGVIVVHGTLTVEDGSAVTGAARARKIVVRSGSLQRNECELRAAVTSPALDRAFRPVGRWWIPAF